MLSETSRRLRLSDILLNHQVATSICGPIQTKVNTPGPEAAVNLAELSFNLRVCQVKYDLRTAFEQQVDDFCDVALHLVHLVSCHRFRLALVSGKKCGEHCSGKCDLAKVLRLHRPASCGLWGAKQLYL